MEDVDVALKVARDVGFPVLVKAAAGGGGKGMRIVHNEKDFAGSVKAAQSEARNAFGDDRVYVEKYLEEPRHIEFQIMADQSGKTVHLYDRECSVQRRHQKVIEEAPSALLDDKLRAEMAEAAIKAAQACNYEGAGTIEFLVDKHKKFYFLEMNTRLQVEHPVTEMITGIDLVEAQIRVAAGEPLPFSQEDISKSGHAIECRVYAEDPVDNFLPSTGTLFRHRIPSGPGVRVDAGVEEGGDVTINYDPMISKLSVHASTREKAIKKMIRALSEYEISGCKTTIPFCDFTMRHSSFTSAEYDTHFVPDYFEPHKHELFDEEDGIDALAVSLIAALKGGNGQNGTGSKEKNAAAVTQNQTNWWKARQ